MRLRLSSKLKLKLNSRSNFKSNLRSNSRLNSRLNSRSRSELKKHGQVAGQIFIYILAIIVVSFILLYGYKAIKSFGDRGEQVAYISLKSDLENAFNGIRTDFGSIKRPQLDVPGKYKKLCFIDLKNPSFSSVICAPPASSNLEYEPGVCTGWKVGRNNLYLCPDCTDSFNIGAIKIKQGDVENSPYLCIPVINGRVNLQLEGKGDHVYVSTFEKK